MSERRIPLSDLDYGSEEEAAVLRVVRSRWLSSGPEVQAFEREFAEAHEVRFALAVANATAALHLSYLALGIGPGDEVIQPAINFVAAANTTMAVGATPVLVDVIGVDEPTLDPAAVERAITPNTRAIVPMHYGGYFSRMAELQAIGERRGIAIVEDACHAVGSRYLDPTGQARAPHGTMAGALGAVGCFSFFSNKNMATGEGGMLTTDREDVADALRLLRSHGMTTLSWDRHRGHASSYDVLRHGFNYRLDELHAALGRVQLAKLARNNARRRELVQVYREHLAGLDGWVIPFEGYEGETSCHLMVAVAPDGETRQRVTDALKQEGIQTSLHYPCIPDFAAFERFAASDVPHSRAYASRTITLPLYPTMDAGMAETVSSVLRAAAEHGA